jgi:hypothetical protein
MSAWKWVNVPNMFSALRKRVPESATRDETLDAVRKYVGEQPDQPDLVSATEAAAMMKVKPPHVTRMRQRGRMPWGIKIAGGRKNPTEAYVRSDIEQLAKELAEERARRAPTETGESDDD